jgi:hypothetical protein
MKAAFERLARSVGVSEPEPLWKLQGNRVMSPGDVRSYVEELHPSAKQVFTFWHDTPAKHTNLTSVVVAIARANVRQKDRGAVRPFLLDQLSRRYILACHTQSHRTFALALAPYIS